MAVGAVEFDTLSDSETDLAMADLDALVESEPEALSVAVVLSLREYRPGVSVRETVGE